LVVLICATSALTGRCTSREGEPDTSPNHIEQSNEKEVSNSLPYSFLRNHCSCFCCVTAARRQMMSQAKGIIHVYSEDAVIEACVLVAMITFCT
jgi:hypothetical protein